jgi:hypothetical protein
MGIPTLEVSYTSATARRGDHEGSYEHVVALGKKAVFLFRDVILASYFSTWLMEWKCVSTVMICMLKVFLEK